MEWSNLAKIVLRRTYSRVNGNRLENWDDVIDRVIRGNIKGFNVSDAEKNTLFRLLRERKAIPAGRGLWFSGTEAHSKLGGVALNNCAYVSLDSWENLVLIADLLMLGCGVGVSVEHRFVSKLPTVKPSVTIVHKPTKDADFIIPDSREGWCEAMRRAYEAFFITGKSYSYSTICIRGAGEPIKSFGGVSSGPLPLIRFFENINKIFSARASKHLRPIDVADIVTAIGEVVVSGNVRRSAILIMGDCWDKEFLKAKRWDLGPLPSYRSCANYSVVCEDIDDLHPLYWKTFENGEAFGLVNRKNIQRYGRIGERKKDTAVGVNPCGEAVLESGELCNLQEIALPSLKDEEEFILAARMMHRWGKRVSCESYHHPEIDRIVKRNRRIGTSITGCLASPLFNPKTLDRVYEAIQKENIEYAKALSCPPSIRTTVIKPSGTVSKLLDMNGFEGIHPAYSRYIIQRIRFAANDPLIPILKEAGHKIEPLQRLDGTQDPNTLVVDFYVKAPDGYPVADEGFDTWEQLKVWRMAQQHWADQSVSISVYYRREEIDKIRQWLKENIDSIKTISFLAHSGHGFAQAPKEAISREEYEKNMERLKPIDVSKIGEGELESQECEGNACPVK